MAARALLVDVHTHMYLPRYASLLRARSSVPFIRSRQDGDRLVILDNEPSGGRPVGPQYWDRDEKLAFMDKHGIDISVVSTANPWLDFLTPSEATDMATKLNTDLEDYCATGPTLQALPDIRRLFGMGLLPIVEGVEVPTVLQEVERISKLPHLRGVIMGTQGLGNGLDDDALEPVWEAIARTGLVVFLHPHYGLSSSAPQLYGPKDNGHVLPLALGFPFETTIAVTRLILAGALDRHPDLKLLLAHSGGALPQLSSRLASCIEHDPAVKGRLKHDARWYLGKLWFDAVAYGPEEMSFVSSTIGRASRYDSSGAAAPAVSASSRMMFGTDHPFFPPVGEEGPDAKWMSVVENLKSIDAVSTWSEEEKHGVRGGNAMKLFELS
ncbi:amidohydrolase 2 [Clavulina sp. PMI_390]|nr:amidohydrolase 2 [Clavulina sp. PMI_390]